MSEDQGKEDLEEAEVGTEPVPGPQSPKLITQFFDNHSMAETVL